MRRQLERATSRSRSALEEFLDRTVVHEQAGGRMPGEVFRYALLGAVLTLVIGLIGVAATEGPREEFLAFVRAVAWTAAGFGAVLSVTAICLCRARSAASRSWMQFQLAAGAVVPGVALLLVLLYLAVAALVVWLIFMGIAAWLESL